MLRYRVILPLLLAVGLSAGADPEWHTLKGKHFIIRYTDDRDAASLLLDTAEDEYRRIANELGFTRYDDFWLWNDRARITVYPDRASFRKAVDAPTWATGKASYQTRRICTFAGSSRFLTSVLPHEMTHLIFRDFIGFRDGVPLWLDEGVAQWMEHGRRQTALDTARGLLKHGRLLTLDSLTETDVRKTLSNRDAAEFYAQSVSLVAYLIQEHGARRFRSFCGHLRDGKSLDDALRFTYPDTIRNIGQLERAWKNYLEDSL